MIVVISLIVFLFGILVFILNSLNMKKEQDYVDNFIFMISDHDDKQEYYSIFNQISEKKELLDDFLYELLSKYFSESEMFTMLPSGGLIEKRHKTNFFLCFFLEVILCVFLILSLYGMSIKSIITVTVFLYVNNILVRLLFEKFFIKEEKARIKVNFTYFLDLLATATKSGMTIELALIAVSEYIGPMSLSLSNYIQIYSNDISTNGFSIANENLRKNIDIQEIKDFTAVLENAIESGAAVNDALRVLSKETRDFHFIETEENIGKISAKMGVPLILFIMFPIIIEIIAPGVLNLMSKL
ncbi:type II secretion system protein TadC [Vibrio sagamiensis NBRC 104589]|uniref:Type II secretion system protein TadC n=2 Tax=Vibrio sagamiensis TaxID=512650 RepID=A0A511QFD7_9VIBR|nr:type II secretion system protein TadC [Vibrio sagamiensis NBRC 104589]